MPVYTFSAHVLSSVREPKKLFARKRCFPRKFRPVLSLYFSIFDSPQTRDPSQSSEKVRFEKKTTHFTGHPSFTEKSIRYGSKTQPLCFARQVSAGTYVGSIRLARPLDFDTVSSYKLTVRASDGGGGGGGTNKNAQLSSAANVSVVVKDVQDERPVFTNSPYTIVIDENAPAGVQVLMVTAVDGDAGPHKRPVVLSVEDDSLGYFAVDSEPNGTAYVFTSHVPIDRENKAVSDAGGIYTFRLKVGQTKNVFK